jgi:hypothetical protein
VILEHDLPTTPKGVQQIDVLAGYPNCEVPLNAIYSCLDAAYLTLLLPLQHFLRFRRDFWPISISTLAMAAAVSASSSVMSFSDPSWLKSSRGSKKAILASSCRTRSTEMSSRCCRSSITSFSSAWTLTFLNIREAATEALLELYPAAAAALASEKRPGLRFWSYSQLRSLPAFRLNRASIPSRRAAREHLFSLGSQTHVFPNPTRSISADSLLSSHVQIVYNRASADLRNIRRIRARI